MNTAVASVLADVTRRVGRGSDLFRYVRHEFYSANKDFDLHDRNGSGVLRARGGVMEFVMDDGHVRGAATPPVRDASDAVLAAVARALSDGEDAATDFDAPREGDDLPADRALCELTRAERVYPLSFGDLAAAGGAGGGVLASDGRRRLARL